MFGARIRVRGRVIVGGQRYGYRYGTNVMVRGLFSANGTSLELGSKLTLHIAKPLLSPPEFLTYC